ncbi:microtubule-associated protein futsch [Heterodontus francisci]|uniref:microtubule-associated protein futsch n=1 Tax=Heterodontus francisci TaxID=7792 RepID=UPI00355BDBFD
MAKLCRHHQIQFMSVLTYMRSEANPAEELSESSVCEDMAASSPAPVQLQPKSPEDRTERGSVLQPCPSSPQETRAPNELNCKKITEEKWLPHEEMLLVGTEASSAPSIEKPTPRGCCSSGTCIKNCTLGAGFSSVCTCTTDCNKNGSVEALQKETVNRKEISDSQLDQSSSERAHISTVPQIVEVSSNSQESKKGGAVAAKAQNESLRALPEELLNLSTNLTKYQSDSRGSSGAPSDHKAIKHTSIPGGPRENSNATKRTIKDNHVLAADASAKDCWFVSKPHPPVRDTNGRLRIKAQAPPTKTARKSTRVSVLRARSSMSTMCQYVNEHDNQCDIVYISKPITECRFDAQRSLSSSRKTARKSTRGHLCNEEYWELKTVRTLAKNSAMEARKGNCLSLIPIPPAPVTPKQALTLPVSVPAIGIPVGASTSIHEGSKVQLKVLPEANQDFRCSESNGELVVEPSQTCQSQEAEAPSRSANSPQVEPKRPSGQATTSSSKSHSVKIKSTPLSSVQASGHITTRADCGALGESSPVESAACESSEPLKLLKECRKTQGSPSKLEQLVDERGDREGKSSTVGSSNNLEPSPTYQSQNPSVSSLDKVSTSPVNNIVVNIPPQEQCNKELSGNSKVLNSATAMNNIPSSSIAGDQQAGDSIEPVENVNEVQVEKSLTEKEGSNRSGQPLSFPTEVIASSVTPKEDSCPQIASRCKDESSRNDPGEPTLELMKGPHQGTDSMRCNMAANDPCLEKRRLEDLYENVTDHKREGGNSTKKSPESEKHTSHHNEKTLSPAASEKKKHRKKLELTSSDRCLRSQQSRPQTVTGPSDIKEEPLVRADGLLVPCLNIKLLRGQGERGYKREVCVNRVTCIEFPTDCFNKILLQSITDPESRVGESLATMSEQYIGKTRKTTAKHVSKDPLAKELESLEDEELMEDSFIYERAPSGQVRILEVCVDAESSEERKVFFSIQNVGTSQDSESSDGSMDDTSPATRQQSSLWKADTCKENPKWARGPHMKRSTNFGSLHQVTKGMAPKIPPGDKKAVGGSHNLRCPNLSITEPEKIVLGEDCKYLNVNQPTEVLRENEDCELVDLNDTDVPEVSQPKFLDWCSEDENQELITTLNATYENIHKAWIQMEKEVPVMQKAKSKSDRLKEIWKSKRRARKARGLYDHKISPVQKLFVTNFNLTNICKWFMETTETRSLIIVKNVSARNPVETMKAKTFLQKNSIVGLFPSPQAERLKKHLKKFAVASPARNNWKTRALLDNVQRRNAVMGGDRARQQHWGFTSDDGGGLAPRDLFLAKVEGSPVEGGGFPNNRTVAQPSKHLGLKKPVSAWILRKYSNMRGKLHKLQHGKEQVGRKLPAKHKSVCMNPLVSPKLTSQTQLDSRGALLPTAPRKPGERKGKRKVPKDTSVKEPRVGRVKSSKSEAGPPLLPSKSVSKQLPANRKSRVEGSCAKPPAPKKAGSTGKANVLSPKGAVKRFPGTSLKTVPRGKSLPQTRDGAKGKKTKTKGSSGKERQIKPAKKTAGSSAKAKRGAKTDSKKRSKVSTPISRKRKGEVASEATHKKKRKLNKKRPPVPNKRKRTDAK